MRADLESLQSEDEQLGVVLVGERGEGNGGEAAALQPVHHGGVDGHCLLRGDVGPVLRRGEREREREREIERERERD